MSASVPANGPALPAWFLRGWDSPFLLCAFFLYAAIVLGRAFFGNEGLAERDGYYHARYAQMLPERGLSRQFPWTQASVWRDRFFDKEFLYHALLAPFCRQEAEPVVGAKLCHWLLALAALAASFALFRAHGVRWPLLFAALLLCISGPFLVRLVIIRSHVLSLLFLLAGLHFAIRDRWKALAALGFAYSWTYTFPYALVAVVLPFAFGKRLAGDRFDWRPPLAATAGVTLGLVLHPYTPHILDNLITTLRILNAGLGPFGMATGGAPMDIGGELYAWRTLDFLMRSPLLALSWLGLAAAGWLAGRRLTPAAMGTLCAALAWLGVSLVYARFQEYSAPFTVLALAFVVRDALEGADLRGFFSRRPYACVSLAAGAGLVLSLCHAGALRHLDKMISGHPPPRFRAAAKWMQENLAPGETVANLYWDDFPDLYYDAYRQHFLWALDPYFTVRSDPEAASLLQESAAPRSVEHPDRLAERFGARYMVLSTDNPLRVPSLSRHGVRPAFLDEHAMIVRLTEPGSSFPAGDSGPPAAARQEPPGLRAQGDAR